MYALLVTQFVLPRDTSYAPPTTFEDLCVFNRESPYRTRPDLNIRALLTFPQYKREQRTPIDAAASSRLSNGRFSAFCQHAGSFRLRGKGFMSRPPATGQSAHIEAIRIVAESTSYQLGDAAIA